MEINAKKTYVQALNRNINANITINNKVIPQVKEHRLLGMIVD